MGKSQKGNLPNCNMNGIHWKCNIINVKRRNGFYLPCPSTIFACNYVESPQDAYVDNLNWYCSMQFHIIPTQCHGHSAVIHNPYNRVIYNMQYLSIHVF